MGLSARRKFLIAASGLVATGFGRAQVREVGRVPTIGYLSPDAVDPKYPPSGYPSTKALRKLGWIEGENVVIERRFAAHDPGRLAGLARELVTKRVELLIAYTGSAAVAAARATRTIPIVFIGVPFPVEQGLVDSFARPGRNLTGTSTFLSDVGVKRFEFLREIAPLVRRVYVILSLEFLDTVAGGPFDRMASLRAEGERLGFEVQGQVVRESKNIETALPEAIAWGAQAIFPAAGLITNAARKRIAGFALQHRLPSMSTSAAYVDAGGLLSYGIPWAEFISLTEHSMEYVDRILRGASPADLPVIQPRYYELVINKKTAKALDLEIPRSLLMRADRLIELH